MHRNGRAISDPAILAKEAAIGRIRAYTLLGAQVSAHFITSLKGNASVTLLKDSGHRKGYQYTSRYSSFRRSRHMTHFSWLQRLPSGTL